MPIPMYQFLTKENSKKLLRELIPKIDSRINDIIIKYDNMNEGFEFDKKLMSSLVVYLLVSGLQDTDVNINYQVGNHDMYLSSLKERLDKLVESDTSFTDRITAAENQQQQIDALIKAFAHLTIQVYIGNVDDITEPQNDILYFVKPTTDDKFYKLYIHTEEFGWISAGSTELIGISNLYPKDDIETLRTDLGITDFHTSNALNNCKLNYLIDAYWAN